MLVTKSDRISILPITNKNKLISLSKYFDKILFTKNQISKQLNKDKAFQNLLFSNKKEDSKLLLAYCNKLNYPILSAWELQKFVNADFIDKEKNRIEQFFVQYKASLFKYETDLKRNIRFSTNLGKLVALMVKNFFYDGYFNDKINEIIESNNFFINHRDRIFKLVNHITYRYKYHRKPIEYKTSSMIKCDQRILGYSTPRMIKNDANKLYKHWLCFDYIDDNCEKQKINLPLAYNDFYHKDFSQYNKALGENKFKRTNLNRKSFLTSKACSLYVVKLEKSKHKSIQSNQDKINILFEKEFQISFSKRTNRLTITLPKKVEHNLVKSKPNKDNSLGVDLGGSIKNTLVDSNGRVIGFNHLEKLIKKFNIVDKLPSKTREEKLVKGELWSRLSRINEYYINNIITTYLNDCKNKGVEHLIFEKLDSWNVKWKFNNELDAKYNRVFRLIRQQGIVELFKKQARNNGIVIHNIPSFYTSQRCSCCFKVDKNNLKSDRIYLCQCGNNIDRDINAAKNIKDILERFSSKLCKQNAYNEYESIKYISKEFTKRVLLGEKVEKFSSKSC